MIAKPAIPPTDYLAEGEISAKRILWFRIVRDSDPEGSNYMNDLASTALSRISTTIEAISIRPSPDIWRFLPFPLKVGPPLSVPEIRILEAVSTFENTIFFSGDVLN